MDDVAQSNGGPAKRRETSDRREWHCDPGECDNVGARLVRLTSRLTPAARRGDGASWRSVIMRLASEGC